MAGSTTSVVSYAELGQYDRALANEQEAVRLDRAGSMHYANVVSDYLYLGRFDEAQAAAKNAKAKGADSPVLESFLYQLAFVKGDIAGMAAAANWGVAKAGMRRFATLLPGGNGCLFRLARKSSANFPAGRSLWLRRPVTKKRRLVIRRMPPYGRGTARKLR